MYENITPFQIQCHICTPSLYNSPYHQCLIMYHSQHAINLLHTLIPDFCFKDLLQTMGTMCITIVLNTTTCHFEDHAKLRYISLELLRDTSCVMKTRVDRTQLLICIPLSRESVSSIVATNATDENIKY